jgi:predicted transcriptional regulator
MANARDALASVVAAMEEDGEPIPESFDASPEELTYNPADYHDPRIVLLPVEVGGRSVRINVTMDEGLVARLDSLADRAHASRSALLARGARMVLAAEAVASGRDEEPNLAEAIRRRFAPLGGVELEAHPPLPGRRLG